MCICTPEVKTPFCGRPGCEWPKREKMETEGGQMKTFKIKELEWEEATAIKKYESQSKPGDGERPYAVLYVCKCKKCGRIKKFKVQ